jgi:RHS repeat-associated protein
MSLIKHLRGGAAPRVASRRQRRRAIGDDRAVRTLSQRSPIVSLLGNAGDSAGSLGNGAYDFVYGPGNMPVEQINNTIGTVSYLHHDQAGSTRLITGSTGTVTDKCSYSAYGTPTCEGTTMTPLGYDGQYTSSDTGLIYLRAREYDPATAQFLSVDPLVWLTRAP